MSSDAVRRIMAEMKEFAVLNASHGTFFHAAPLESDLFEWHFSVRGPPDTSFADGVYHGRIVLPAEYPLKPPEIILLTPNGRFEVGKRICLSVTAHHQETWQPSWGIRTILTALVGFMPSKAEGVGALDFPDADRRRLARNSWSFHCERCGAHPIEQLVVPAAVKARFPGAATLPSDTSDLQPDSTSLKSEPPSFQNVESSSAASSAPTNSDTSILARDSACTQVPSSSAPVPKLSPTTESSVAAQPISTQAATIGHISPSPGPPPPSPVTSQELPRSSPETESQQPVPLSTPTSKQPVQERELLYLAYAIVAAIIAVIVRRIIAMAMN